MFQTYKPSGSIGVMTIPISLFGLVIVIALAYLYQLLIYWIPLIYVNFLLTAGFGFALGLVGTFAVKFGHVRNVMIGGLIGLLFFVAGFGAKFYFQHGTFIDEVTDIVMTEEKLPEAQRSDVRKEAAAKFNFWKHIDIRVQQGWSIGRGGGGGAQISGVFVYIIWAIEALIIIFLAVFIPSGSAGEPYNEQQNQWADEEEVVMTLPISSPEMVTQIQNSQDVDDLLNIPIPKSDLSNQFAVYKVNSIAGQELEDAYLTVVQETHTTKKDGEVEKQEQELVKYAILNSENRKRLVENAELLNEAIAEYQASQLQEDQEEQNESHNGEQ